MSRKRIVYGLLLGLIANGLWANFPQLNWIQFRQKTGGTLAEFNQYKRDYATYHPADISQDHVISSTELENYADAWRNGEKWARHGNQQIPIDYVSLAAQIQWEFDGLYFYFGDHFEGIEDVNDIYNYYSYGLDSVVGGVGWDWVSEYYIYKPPSVTVELNPPDGFWVVAIEETLPAGWTAEQYRETWEGISKSQEYQTDVEREDRDLEMAAFSVENGRTVVRWGPFDGYPNTLRYAVAHPEGLLPDSDQIVGVQSYDGVSRPTLERTIKPAFEKRYPEYNDFGINISDADVPVPNVDFRGDANGDGYNNLIAWLTTGNLEVPMGDLKPVYTLVNEVGVMKMKCRYYLAVQSWQAKVYFLRSTDLTNWFYTQAESIQRLPNQDVGQSLAYEATLLCEGGDYFRLLWAEDFSRGIAAPKNPFSSSGHRKVGDPYIPATE
ncbi:hypothetical protein [Cerasicoccus arenae]|uniref:Uncharacterized protein n=1 Tax=Cerasicoccus arenae TaxID=424488 RepID=A0A8J3GBU4_9BACT|nr:hypothetical protein [Cerasicoccus arenae]MBK1856913.1 hypothetical protein [Cerasicoccus arenae]GHB89815.1 hypothetical protein GCM10007047_00380 [Cerasicoccus arenae]